MSKEGRWCGDAGKVMIIFLWRSTSLWATLQRSLPGEVLLSKPKTSCGLRHDWQHAMWPPETHYLTPLMTPLRISPYLILEIVRCILKLIFNDEALSVGSKSARRWARFDRSLVIFAETVAGLFNNAFLSQTSLVKN